MICLYCKTPCVTPWGNNQHLCPLCDKAMLHAFTGTVAPARDLLMEKGKPRKPGP